MRLGFVTQTHTGAVSAAESIDRAAREGFDFVELYMDGATTRERLDRERLADRLDAGGLDLLVHLPFADLDLGTPRDRVRSAAVAEQRECIETAAELGAEKAVLHASTHATPPEWEREATDPRLLDSVRELDAFAADRGVEICVENLPGVPLAVHDFDAVFAETDAAMTFDTGHARVDGMDEDDMAAFLDAHADRVSHVHANDSRAAADEHVPTGSGTLDFAAALEPLRDGWNGTVSLEIYTFDFDYLALAKRKFDAVA